MEIGNLYISESASVIVDTLKLEFLHRELPYFSTLKDSAGNIMTQCPFHKEGRERKPSFGISKNNMTCHCFSCGWAGGIDEVISIILGHVEDNGEFGRKWLAQRFLSVSLEKRVPLNLATRASRSREDCGPVVNPFDEAELSKYRFYHDYMFKRGLTDEIIELFDVGFDHETNCLTFPVYHVDGSSAFVARRSVATKFFNYPSGVTKPVYAADLVVRRPDQVIALKHGVLITESIFNCLTAWKQGWPAVSLLGLGNEFQYEILRKLPVRGYTLALDPDEAGRKATAKLRQQLPNKILRQLDLPEGVDVNDLDTKLNMKLSQIPVLL